MEGYLGEFPVEISESPYAEFTPEKWATYWIGSYGQIHGAHHKLWVLDQVVRILKGTPVIVTLAKWSNGYQEYRHTLGEPTAEYHAWVEMMLDRDEDGEPQYAYDVGIAP